MIIPAQFPGADEVSEKLEGDLLGLRDGTFLHVKISECECDSFSQPEISWHSYCGGPEIDDPIIDEAIKSINRWIFSACLLLGITGAVAIWAFVRLMVFLIESLV